MVFFGFPIHLLSLESGVPPISQDLENHTEGASLLDLFMLITWLYKNVSLTYSLASVQ